MIEIIEKYSIEECKKYPNKIFVFGDNLIEKGTGGQAIIRNEPNSFGIPTKRLPNMMESSFFFDKKDEETRLKEKLYLLNDLFKQNKTIVFPKNGIGTGLAKMQEKSPILFSCMISYLMRSCQHPASPGIVLSIESDVYHMKDRRIRIK